MYILHITAIPEESNEEYKEHRTYEILVVINTLSRKFAVERAKTVLQENHWGNIDIQLSGMVREEQKEKFPMDHSDHFIFIFKNSKNETGIRKIFKKARALFE